MEGGRTKCVSCQQQQQSEMITPNSERPRCLASCSFHRNQNPFPGEGRRSFRAKLKSMMSGNVSPKAESLNRKPLPAESSQARSKKRALLCGVSYKKQKYKLRGTINDVRRIRELLVDTFNFPVESIRVLTVFGLFGEMTKSSLWNCDVACNHYPTRGHGGRTILFVTKEEPEAEFRPTKKNIEQSLQWLVEGCQSEDSLVFFFSGHGLRQPDFNNDELDGFDETLCPVDFLEQGMIVDNFINSTIVRPLTHGVKLHAIVDCCHSGTILDLAYVYDKKNGVWMDNRPPSGANKSTTGGVAICFSACKDPQMAADTSVFTGKEMSGAMTYSFVSAIKKNSSITYGQLLDSIDQDFEKANEVGCLKSHILMRLFHNKILQDPLLSSSVEFDIYSEKFQL